VLPDGSVHDPGSLKLCLERVFSPVAAHHRVYVEGRAIHMVQSRVGHSESPSGDQPFFLFHRNALDQLELIGYGRPDRGTQETHILVEREDHDGSATLASDRNRMKKEETEFVLVAAR
ncbi:MAG: hypothetical protein R3344_08985, partial [Acidobacteriota bacterium]|nr:hypothetical protein [Acidobacteriota bacterium]